MNAVDVGAWKANWAWSLPLIVLSVVIHVIGLGLIYESVVRVLSGAIARRRFMSKFAVVRLLLGNGPDFQLEPLPYSGIGTVPIFLVLGAVTGLRSPA
jgi:hypothetical protein